MGLLTYLDGKLFKFFFQKFTIHGAIDNDRKDGEVVKQAFMHRFSKPEEPQEVIWKAADGTLIPKDFLASMDQLDYKYTLAGFNDEAKFEFLRVAVTKTRTMAIFAMYRGVGKYSKLKKAIMDLGNGLQYFSSAGSEVQVVPDKWLEMQAAKDVLLLVCLDALVQNMEIKIDSLAVHLSTFTLLLKKSQTVAVLAKSTGRNHKRAQTGQFFDQTCSYCNKPCHGVNRCRNNPDRRKRCANCGKAGHGVETCWAKKQSTDIPIKKKFGQVTFIKVQEDSSCSESDSELRNDDNGKDAFNVLVEPSNYWKSRSRILSIKRNVNGEARQRHPKHNRPDHI